MSSSVPPPFQDASKQQRLLKRVASNTDLLNFAVTVWDLDALPSYHAISYTWGSPSDTASICINGRPQTVRHNCYYSLWQVGLDFVDHYVWIDSICIDQASLEEKNSQVQMVGQIHLGAEAVLACLGPHADGSEQLHRRHLMNMRDVFEGSIDLLLYNTLRKFWHRPYWKRVWIVQETNLARQLHILCGEHILTFKDFSRYPWRSDWKSDLPCVPSSVRQIILNNWKRESLWAAVDNYTGRGLLCENPRDHVYGMLALVTDATTSPILVDYSIALPDLVLELIKRHYQPIAIDFSRELQLILQAFHLVSDMGLPSSDLQAWSAHQPYVFDGLDSFALAACWDNYPMRQGIPDVIEHLPQSCKMATFDADRDGRLVLKPFVCKQDLLPPPLRRTKPTEKPFIPSSEGITEVTVDATIDKAVCTMTARITSTARPGDLLLRIGHHVFAHPHRIKVGGTMRQETQWLPSVGHYSDPRTCTELAGITSEYLAVIRWLGPGLWKVVAHGHMTSCTPRTDRSKAVCFEHTRRNYEVMYSLMSPVATFVLWTHCNILWETPEKDRMAKIDEIVSSPPPSSYYYTPGLGFGYPGLDHLEDCRADVDPEWKEKYCSQTMLPYSNPPHLWFWKHAKEFEIRRKHIPPGAEGQDIFRLFREMDY